MGEHRRSHAIGSWGEPMRKHAAVRGLSFTLARVTGKGNFDDFILDEKTWLLTNTVNYKTIG